MRHAYRPDIPPPPPPYRTQVFDHLGLVAGRLEELGITDVMDRAPKQDPAMRIVPAGHAGKALGLNGLDVLNHQRDLVPPLFPHQPRARLMAPGMPASPLQDEPLGRALATLDACGVTALSGLMATTVATRLGLTPTFRHRATTSWQVDGRSTSAPPPDAPVVHSPHGESREHRPDLTQGMLE